MKASNGVPTMRPDCDSDGCSWDLSHQQRLSIISDEIRVAAPNPLNFSKFANCIDDRSWYKQAIVSRLEVAMFFREEGHVREYEIDRDWRQR